MHDAPAAPEVRGAGAQSAVVTATVSGVRLRVSLLDLRRDATAVAHGEAVGLGPFADRGSVAPGTGPTRGGGGARNRRLHLARVADPRRERVTQRSRVLGIEVDLVGDAVKAEVHGLVGGTAVDVVFENELNLLNHSGTSLPRHIFRGLVREHAALNIDMS